MRTIKFKGKSLMNGQWVTGDLAHSLDGKLNILGLLKKKMAEWVLPGYFKLTPPPSASSPASPIRMARRFMKATYCGPTSIRSVVPKPTSMTIITAR